MYKQPNPSPSREKHSSEEQQILFQRCALGDLSAREQIILAYLPFVANRCKMHVGAGTPFEDLFQEGCYGLILALDRFDPDRGTTFASYASDYVDKYIKKAKISQNSLRPIIYKEDFFYELQKYLRILDEQTERLDRHPTDSELASALKTTENRIRHLCQCLHSFFSIDDVILDADIQQKMPTISFHSAEDEALERMHIFDLSCYKVTLTKREEEVIRRRFGFTDSGVPEPAAKISKELAISTESVRLAYLSALKKLKDAVKKSENSQYNTPEA